MRDLQCFHDWQEAERRAEIAQDAVTAILRDRHSPTQAQLDELQQLRDCASVKLREMVAALKAATQRERRVEQLPFRAVNSTDRSDRQSYRVRSASN